MSEPITIRMPSPAPYQQERLNDGHRWKCWVAGRRARKTSTAWLGALLGHGPNRCLPGALTGGNIVFIGLNAPQSMSVWNITRATLRPIAVDISEVARRIVLPGGGAFQMRSAASPESLIGDVRGWDGCVLDEASKFSADVFYKSVRPALADRHGWAWFTTTPDGATGWFKDLYDAAKQNPEWKVWHDPSTINPYFDPQEIERSIAAGMPRDVAASEYGAEFVTIGSGRAYHEFIRERHVRPVELDESLPISCCLSFKGDPPALLVTQHDDLSERVLEEITHAVPSVPNLAAAFKRKYPLYSNGSRVTFYGDATSGFGAKSTSHSDYEPFRTLFPRAQHRINHGSHLSEKDHVNALNEILRGPPGREFTSIAPGCTRLISDLENTPTKTNTFAIDATPGRGHFATALAMKLHYRFPLGVRRWADPVTGGETA